MATYYFRVARYRDAEGKYGYSDWIVFLNFDRGVFCLPQGCTQHHFSGNRQKCTPLFALLIAATYASSDLVTQR